MKKSFIAIAVVFIAVILVSYVAPLLIREEKTPAKEYQHELNSNADSHSGTTTVSASGNIDSNFITHLPLVIIDFQGKELPNIYQFTSDGSGREYSETGLANPDPWVSMHMQIIDNVNGTNSIDDKAAMDNYGLIKLRGMTSRTFEKKQYGIKLMEMGEEAELSVLGMDADEDWVLSNSILDLSGIRNYMSMNIGGQVFPYTPDVRFCEVVFKDGDSYTYEGLYLMTEKVKKADGHIEMNDYEAGSGRLNYVVCRDRYDKTKTTLSTWASDNQICYGYFTLEYPNEDILSSTEIKQIEDELTKIEKCIYSDDMDEFLKYSNYIDVDSFVDYFIINEFFMNYDAGDNSTYYYKNYNEKLAIGPLWDYDNCFDNYSGAIADYEYLSFASQPWFEELVKDKTFQSKLVKRYKELRKTILSDAYVNEFIDKTMNYLGNARSRDFSRWKNAYNESHKLDILKDEEGFIIDRNTYSVEAEVQRMKDILSMHGKWMDKNIGTSLASFTETKVETAKIKSYSWIIVMGIAAFFSMLVLINRKMNGA